MSVLPVKLTTD